MGRGSNIVNYYSFGVKKGCGTKLETIFEGMQSGEQLMGNIS
jgi:hypothetical protein